MKRTVFFLLTAFTLTSCATQSVPARAQQNGFQLGQAGRIYARPAKVATPSGATGILKLNLSEASARDGWYYVPAKRPKLAPVILMLHGSLDDGEKILAEVKSFADDIGAIVIAPDSRSYTWELSQREAGPEPLDRFGNDVIFIDRALSAVFKQYPIDRKRIAIGGFSDGGTFALSLGLMNGDLFSHVMAFSPGFVRVRSTSGHPHVFLSHGRSDDVLPIDSSRSIARAIDQAGYEVEFIEFDGKHIVPRDVAREALTEWFVGDRAVGAAE